LLFFKESLIFVGIYSICPIWFLKVAKELRVQTYSIFNGIFIGSHSIAILFQEYGETRVSIEPFRWKSHSKLVHLLIRLWCVGVIAFFSNLIETGLEHLHFRSFLDKVSSLSLKIVLCISIAFSIICRLILALSQMLFGVVKVWVLSPVGSLTHHIILEMNTERILRRPIIIDNLRCSIVRERL
jgi:hypothetical protein